MKLLLLLTATATMVAGCAAPAEFSYLNGFRWTRVELNTYDTRIVSVDGYTRRQNEKLFVDPGVRTIVLEAPPAAGFFWPQQREIVVKVEHAVLVRSQAGQPLVAGLGAARQLR
jgi:hypothetical protein